jgi:hypothetical protein
LTEPLKPNLVFDENEKKVIGAIGSATQAFIIGNLVVSVLQTVVMSESLSSVWGMVNALQLLHCMPIMTLYYSDILHMLFAFIGIANMQNAYLALIYLFHFDSAKLDRKQPYVFRFVN